MIRTLAASAIALTVSLATPATAGEMRDGGKLLLTNGISSLEGASGGGITPWAVIAGNETRDGIGVSAHGSLVRVKDYAYQSAGISIGLFDRVELSYARQNFNTKKIGALLGLGENFAFNQDVIGAKLKVAGDLVYGDALMPAIAIGAEYKKNDKGAVIGAIGGRKDSGVDYYVSASKLLLSRSILLNATLRMTKANQLGILGFGGDKNDDYKLEFEGTGAWQLSRRLAIGGEYRAKPDNLGIAREDDWFDVFAAYAITPNVTLTIAYVDLGSIATVKDQRGVFVSLQAAY